MTVSMTPVADLVISGATVVTGTATFEGSVAIKDVRIMALGETRAMLEGVEIIARHGLRIALHAETASIMAWREKRLQAAGRNDPLAHLASRPAVVAVAAVSRAAVLAEWTGARIHILHISSADELRPLREAKARGVDITGETCPHYLLFDEHAYAEHRSLIRVNPPVREKR